MGSRNGYGSNTENRTTYYLLLFFSALPHHPASSHISCLSHGGLHLSNNTFLWFADSPDRYDISGLRPADVGHGSISCCSVLTWLWPLLPAHRPTTLPLFLYRDRTLGCLARTRTFCPMPFWVRRVADTISTPPVTPGCSAHHPRTFAAFPSSATRCSFLWTRYNAST